MVIKFKDLSFGLKAFVIAVPLVCVYLLWQVYSLNSFVYTQSEIILSIAELLRDLTDITLDMGEIVYGR